MPEGNNVLGVQGAAVTALGSLVTQPTIGVKGPVHHVT